MEITTPYCILTQGEEWPESPTWEGQTLCLCMMGTVKIVTESDVVLTIRPHHAASFCSPPEAVDLNEGLVLLWSGSVKGWPDDESLPLSPKNIRVAVEMLEQEDLTSERIQATLHYLSFELSNDPAASQPTTRADILHDYFMENLDQNLDLESMSAHFEMSRSTFLRICGKHLKTSPGKYLSELRIDRAKELLQNPIHTIAQVGYQIGYDSPSTFSHFFKNATGQSPKEYRTNYEWLV